MRTALSAAPVLAIAVLVLVRAEVLGKRRQIYIAKPVSGLILVAVALVSLLEPGRNLVYTTGVLLGLFFSLAGDLALMFQEKRKAFMVGLGFFLVAHVAYTTVFALLGCFSAWDLLSTMVLLVSGVAFYMLIKRNLGAMRTPVIAYMVVVSAMVSRAVSALVSPVFGAEQAFMVATGALLFYCSDLFLAANRFWKPWRYHRISLVPYFTGQFLIALAASYFV